MVSREISTYRPAHQQVTYAAPAPRAQSRAPTVYRTALNRPTLSQRRLPQRDEANWPALWEGIQTEYGLLPPPALLASGAVLIALLVISKPPATHGAVPAEANRQTETGWVVPVALLLTGLLLALLRYCIQQEVELPVATTPTLRGNQTAVPRLLDNTAPAPRLLTGANEVVESRLVGSVPRVEEVPADEQ